MSDDDQIYYLNIFAFQPNPSEIDLRKYWNPEIYIDNVLGEPKRTSSIHVEYDVNGEAHIVERRRVRGTFLETMELWEFPFDIQVKRFIFYFALNFISVEGHANSALTYDAFLRYIKTILVSPPFISKTYRVNPIGRHRSTSSMTSTEKRISWSVGASEGRSLRRWSCGNFPLIFR